MILKLILYHMKFYRELDAQEQVPIGLTVEGAVSDITVEALREVSSLKYLQEMINFKDD